MRFSDALFRALALVGVALILCSVPAQRRDLLGEPDRHGYSSSCTYKQCPYSDKSVCFAIDVEPGTDACGAAEEFTRIRVEAGIARAKRTLLAK